ncbi:MAG: 4-(cytidine 5'-diphospho)-2-C-methyl-D-erythritol kinase [Acidimicrobiia bacterium]|nr:4-(cytidine 5'-diphospho)-2-C-methyl-D-erythritol kinase [Acidimicrobiia bacterium]
MIEGVAYGKVNLGLRVGRLRPDGFHPVAGIFQSIDVADELTLSSANEDSISSAAGRPVVDGLDNLAFRAAAAVRTEARSAQPLAITLDKRIPTAAGLGGGSADAAGALALAGRHFAVAAVALAELAPQLGSDVPFCLAGGTARVGGRGEDVQSMPALGGFALAVVVPPFEIATPAAFRRWDEMDEPSGLRMPQAALPPQLRPEGDLVNDLYPAAASIAAGLDDWRADLERSWGRHVMLSGSGPSLYAFFLDIEEAASAVDDVPSGARFAEACDLSPVGWRIDE